MCKTLIVEDSATFRKTFREALCRQFPDMIIQESADGNEVLEKVTSFQPNLIFMDIRLPGKNGLALTGKIKKADAGIRIIILTDYDLPEYRTAAFGNGADHFVSKGSLNMNEIVGIVEKAQC